MDIMFMNKILFLVTSSRNLHLSMVESLPNCQVGTVTTCLKKVIRLYHHCGFHVTLREFRPSLNSRASHSCDVRQFRSLYTKNRWVISVMGSPIDVGGQYPFITFLTPPRFSGKFLLW